MYDVSMYNAEKGFTLLEMMIVLSLAAIIMTMAVPSYRTFVQNNRITKEVNLLSAAIAGARGESAKRGKRVVLCQSSNPAASTPSCSGTSGTWSNGWIVFVDENSDSSFATSDSDVLLNVFQADGEVDIKTDVGTALAFKADGTTTAGATRTFAVCDERGISNGKKLDVAATGRPVTDTATTCSP